MALSPIYKTKAWGFEGQDFLNAVIEVTTSLSAKKLLKSILNIEKSLGRERNAGATGYEDRPIDIDILFYGERVLDTEKLKVPHPLLQERLFVLKPLADLAPQRMHPVLGKTVSELLEGLPDQTSVEAYKHPLENPKERYDFSALSYLVIEGNIGAGKTTLTQMIARDFNAKPILERFKDNPFLPKFYKNQTRYAFPLEMSFLADRYQQLLDDLGQYDLFKDFLIADYDSQKSLIFAQITLNSDEFSLYKKLHEMMYKDLAKPDRYVYLYQNTERLLANIKKRGRSYEKDISQEYLTKINQGYLDAIRFLPKEKVKIIDISTLDFVKNRSDYLSILNQILT